MARTAITPTRLGTASVILGAATVAAQLVDGNSYPWRSGRRLYVNNAGATALTVSVPAQITVGAQARTIGPATFTVAAGAAAILPVVGAEAQRPSDGLVYIDYTGATASVTVAVLDT